MKRLLLLMVLPVLVGSALAQQIEPLTPPTGTEQIAITYPVPVLAVSGQVTIAGTVSVPNLSNYFVEFRPLVITGPGTPTPPEGNWFPATLPSNRPVTNNVLGVWNTTTAPDGLYELRLVVIAGGRTQFFRVSPVRILNNPEALSPFASVLAAPTQTPPGVSPSGPAATQAALATLFASQSGAVRTPAAPQPTPALTGPEVVANTNANVRLGDSVAYPTVGSLLAGARAPIIGISSTGSGWYFIQLPNGRTGFISPSVVRVEGSLLGIQVVTPPPVPATPTPVATATPVTQADLALSGIRPEPNPPVCLQAFNVFINATNFGSGPSAGPANVRVQSVHVASGTVASSGTAQVPVLAPGQNFVVVIPLNVGVFYNEGHELVATINFDNAVPDTNPANNTIRFSYTLAQGGC